MADALREDPLVTRNSFLYVFSILRISISRNFQSRIDLQLISQLQHSEYPRAVLSQTPLWVSQVSTYSFLTLCTSSPLITIQPTSGLFCYQRPLDVGARPKDLRVLCAIRLARWFLFHTQQYPKSVSSETHHSPWEQ